MLDLRGSDHLQQWLKICSDALFEPAAQRALLRSHQYTLWHRVSSQNIFVLQALRLLEAMWVAGGDISPDTVSYNALLKACGNGAQMRVAVQAREGEHAAFLVSVAEHRDEQ